MSGFVRATKPGSSLRKHEAATRTRIARCRRARRRVTAAVTTAAATDDHAREYSDDGSPNRGIARQSPRRFARRRRLISPPSSVCSASAALPARRRARGTADLRRRGSSTEPSSVWLASRCAATTRCSAPSRSPTRGARMASGRALVTRMISDAEARGIHALYLLTTTAERYFPSFGFQQDRARPTCRTTSAPPRSSRRRVRRPRP